MKNKRKTAIQLRKAAAALCAAVMFIEMIPVQTKAVSIGQTMEAERSMETEKALETADDTELQKNPSGREADDDREGGTAAAEEEIPEPSGRQTDGAREDGAGTAAAEEEIPEPSLRQTDDVREDSAAESEDESPKSSERNGKVPFEEGSTAADAACSEVSRKGGNVSETAKDMSPEKAVGIFETGTDKGRTVSLVQEQDEPLISVTIMDPDHKEIYTCTSEQTQEQRPEDISDYYRTLNVKVSVFEKPDKTETRGYSGIRGIWWALVPNGTDPQSAKKSRTILAVNEAPSDLEDLYASELYRLCVRDIDPQKLVEKVYAKEKGYEKSGSYILYIWAADFCGNGEGSPLSIPLLLDVSDPVVTVQMKNGTEYQGQYYYRADNDRDSSNDGDTPAVTVLAADDREGGCIRNLTACLKGTKTRKELKKQASDSDKSRLIFTVGDLKKHFGDTEQEITITVSAWDDAGNESRRIEEEGSCGVSLKKDGDKNGKSASFIRDAAPPRVTMVYSSSDRKKLHVYQEDKGSMESGRYTVYTCVDSEVAYEVEEAYTGNDNLHWSVSGAVTSDGILESREKKITLSVPEGAEQAYYCTAYGTDLAGNPATVGERFAEGAEIELHPGNLNMKEIYSQNDCIKKGDHLPVFHLVLDRKAPEIKLVYSVDTDANPAGTAFIYDDQNEAGNLLTAYLSGTLSARAVVEEKEDRIDFSRLFFVNPGKEALSWDQTSVGHVSAGPGGRYPSVELAPVKRDGKYFYKVYGTDRAGNNANVTEYFEDGSNLEKMFAGEKELKGKQIVAGENYVPYYAIIIDTASPAVSEIVTKELETDGKGNIKEAGEASPYYYEDDGTFYYKSDGVKTIWKIDEPNFDSARLSVFWNLDGRREEENVSGEDGKIGIPLRKEGKYTDISVRGTDRAGNHIILGPGLGLTASAPAGSGGETASEEIPSQNTAREIRKSGNEGKDQYGLPDSYVQLTFPRIIDRSSPVAVITHIVPDRTTAYLYPEAEGESIAAMYCAKEATTFVRVSDNYGNGKDRKSALLDSGKLKVTTLFHPAGAGFGPPAAGAWNEQKNSPETLSMELRTKEEGHYAFTVEGTDRAGNPVTVQESIREAPERGAVLDTEKVHYQKGEPDERTLGKAGIYTSLYVIVYDKTPPVYSLSINNPSNLQESFDQKTGIAYYGKSISSIQAKFTVTDQNYDGERILAGITSVSASGAKNMENLSPEWSTPDVKGKGTQKEGVTTAIFPLEVRVDRQHEGMYRFEIAGCDKAGNALVPSPEQAEADRSNSLTDLAAGTVPCNTVSGGFWTRLKAVDVTAPKGTMKVQSVRSRGEIYYEIRFEAGGNIPVTYDPFRRERQARLVIETEDSSPTYVSLDLRSLDGEKDAVLKRGNPLTAAGKGIYKTDNSLEVTVDGEQVFYVENLIIRDRAGNVCANDPDSGFTLAKSGNIYLDITGPSVSEIRDTESPRVKIAASGSFTRHEGDGDRFIYRPDGSALDLDVTISDPGGKAHSSGLKEVTVEVRVGDRVVTDKVSLQHLPYTYEKGSRTGHNPLCYAISNARISIPAGSFAESNDITVTVKACDNSGNESVPSRDGGLLKLGIDTTAPRVEVNYHDTVEPMQGRYFRADRIAEIVVIDRNVENSSIKIMTSTAVPSFFTAPHEAREGDGKGESGNEDRWSKTLLYSSDGDYTLQISGSDALGNRISEIKWNGPSPGAFTIDKTRPVIRILLPGQVNERGGVKYYDGPAEAVIEIREHNFTEEAEDGQVRVETSVSSHSGAQAPDIPQRTAFRSAGRDLYTSAVSCRQDGDYEITASYTDPAGNPAVVEGGENRKSEQEAWSGRFTVDTLAPELRLDPETFRVDCLTGLPLEGMENQIYTDRDFAPRVIIRDINYDEAGSDFFVKVYGADSGTKNLIRRDGDESMGEYSLQFNNFEMIREMDGVYRVTAIAADLAKHQTSLEFIFSVNRFGSTWMYADDATERKMDAYYINDTREPLRILEISPVELKTHAVEVFKDHDRRILTEGKQFTFGRAERADGESRSRVYIYTIAPEVYEEEGVYDFILSSSDPAGNKNTTALFRDGTVSGHEISQVKFPIEFQVDKTVPVNRITGIKSGQEQFNTKRLEITVYPEDYQTDIRKVEVRIFKGAGEGKDISSDPDQYMIFREIGEKEDREALAMQHIYPIEEAGKGIPIVLEDSVKWQYLEVITTDLAGNESLDYRRGEPGRNLPETRRRFLITTNPLIRFYSCKPVLYGAGAGLLIILILFFCFRKRREEKKSINRLKP